MDKKEKELPLFELKIDPKKGFEVDTISIVDLPAVESNFLAFSADRPKQIFKENDDKMELLGVAMIPDKKIIRFNEQTKQHYNVWFSKETIREISLQFFTKGYQHSVNLQHSDTFVDAVIYQSFIVDLAKGLPAPKGIDAPDGSWIVGMKLSASPASKRLWKAIKEDKIFQGFSIEGYFIDQITKNFNLEKFMEQENYMSALKELEAELDAFIQANNIQ